MAPRANLTGQISPPMAERQTGSDRFPELGGLCFKSQRPEHFRREHRRRRSQKNASWSQRRRKETQESRPALRDRRLELDFRLERRTSSKNELDIHFYIERLLSSHVA